MGLVTTLPQSLPNWRETGVWSPATVGSVAQGLTSGLRRVVEIKIPMDGAERDVDQWDVIVRIYRRQDARMQVTHTAGRNRLNRLEAPPEESGPSQRASWVSQGRDRVAEVDLRRRMAEAMGSPADDE